MPKQHVVQEGEHLAAIAAAHGFSDPRTIFDHPDNAALKAERKDPNILLPGDVLVIPERERREESAPTDTRTSFTTSTRRLLLRLRVLDVSGNPVEGPAFLEGGAVMQQQDEIREAQIPASKVQDTLSLPKSPPREREIAFPLAIGALDPIRTPSGIRDRLNNLGYFAGFSAVFETEQFKWAVEEFQCDHQKAHKLKVTGVPDKPTLRALAKEYGSNEEID